MLSKFQPGSVKSLHPAKRQTQRSRVFSKLQQLQRSLLLPKFLYLERWKTAAESRAPGCNASRQGTDGGTWQGLSWLGSLQSCVKATKWEGFNEWSQKGALRKRTRRAGRGSSGIVFAPPPSHLSTHPSIAGSTLPSSFWKAFEFGLWILKLVLRCWATHQHKPAGWGREQVGPPCAAMLCLHLRQQKGICAHVCQETS